MAEINASFIPKKDIKTRRAGPGFSVNIFLLIGIVIFLTAVLGSLGVYVWKNQLSALNQESLATLEKNRENYGLAAIEEYIELSNRIEAVDGLLDGHISVAKIFGLLEKDTLTDVIITNFSFDTEEDGMVMVTARGTAPTYEHVAYQAETYGDNRDIKELILSDVDQDRDGTVTFNIEFAVDRSFLLLR